VARVGGQFRHFLGQEGARQPNADLGPFLLPVPALQDVDGRALGLDILHRADRRQRRGQAAPRPLPLLPPPPPPVCPPLLTPPPPHARQPLLEPLDLVLDPVHPCFPCCVRFRIDQDVVVLLRRGEESLELVVVLLQDGVELVVVAARAADRQTQED